MKETLQDFYRLPNINKYEDVCLQSLSEQCSAYEEKVRTILSRLPEKDKHILEAYIDLRNDLEVETFKAALHWGKMHYK
jgi:hypothetical protein